MKEGTVTMADGRTVGFADYGESHDTPVIWCHGGPGSRREPEHFAATAASLGLRVIGIDRPGYGRSTPQPRRTIGGWVGDAFAVADELGIDTFATVGVSIGGAYALALAALSDRLLGTVACCALTDMRWKEGKAMMTTPAPIWNAPSREAACAIVAEQLGEDGGKMTAESDVMPLAPSDARLFADPAFAKMWSEIVPEMFTHGVEGYTDDRLADGGGWGTFDVARIACPVVVLHGTSDTVVPVAHAPYTHSIVPDATLDLRDGLGHFSILPELVPVASRVLRAGSRDAHERGGARSA